MYDLGKQIQRVISGIFFIGISVQIVLGCFWLLGNFGGFQQFADSYSLINVSKSFLCDEYTGILYPVLIMLARGVEKLFSLHYYYVLYLVQLVVACYAAHRFLWACAVTIRRFGSKIRTLKALETEGQNTAVQQSMAVPDILIKQIKMDGKQTGLQAGQHKSRLFWDIWGTMCLLTIPSAMQCHLAVLPNSLTLSFFMVMISYVLEASGTPAGLQAIALVKMMPLWLVTTLLMPEYKILSAVPVLCLFICNVVKFWKQNKRKLLRLAVILAVFAGIILAVGRLIQVPGSHGKMRGTISAVAVRRLVWPWFTENYNFWPEQIREIMDEGQSQEISWYADYVTDRFGPMVEQAVGLKEAQILYRKMARTALSIHTRDIAKELIQDAVSYTVSPFMLNRALRGYGNTSYSGRNYEIMKNNTPGLTRIYVWYGNWWFCAGLILSLLSLPAAWLCRRGADGKTRQRAAGGTIFLLAAASAGMVIWYTLSGAGIMDYKNTVFITILWYSWMLKSMNGEQQT